MSTRGRSRARGRPPKTQSGGRGSTKKPRYLYAGGHTSTAQYRQRLREGLRQDVYADTETDSEPSDNDLVDFDMKYEDADLADNIKMEMDSWKASSDEDRDDDEDYTEGAERALEKSAPEERRKAHRRPITPVFLQDREKPALILPPSSEDLLLSPQYIMRALNVYEVMRRFSNTLRLTPFIFEDFCAALDYSEHSALLSECHISLLKAVLREADSLNTHFGPQDLKDSINIHFYLVDHITWPAALQLYLLADPEHRPTLLSFLGLPADHDDANRSDVQYQSEYPLNVGIECRLDILEFLVNQFLSTTSVRDETIREGVPDHDDHCRVCHKLGDLLCCERCPAVFHLGCLDPPLEDVPSEEWICPVCETNSVPGVTDCVSEMEKAGLLARHGMLGLDREGRKYWFIARRIIGESESKGDVRYYSTITQLNELLCYLDANDFEADLVRTINEQLHEIERQMNITMDLTNAANKTSRKSWLEENQADVETRIKIYNESLELMDIKPVKEEPVEMQTRSKTAAQSQAPFKLGSEGGFKTYSKVYTNHMLALNKHQHAEERDKKRHLSHKFSLTPASEFKWISVPTQATPVSDLTSVLSTVRSTIVHLESQLGSCLFHPQWTSTFRAEWLQAVNKSARTRDYVRALQLLESVIKPCALVTAWTECLGHTFLRRTTQVEREEKKKQDKKERRGIAGFMALYSGVTEDGEDVSDRSLWCKYTLGLKHQVWKQKGEEFRITGTGGWFWNSRTRVVRLQPMAKQGLRAGPAKVSIYIPSTDSYRTVDASKLENASVTRPSGEIAELTGPGLIRAICDQHTPSIEDVIDVGEALLDPKRKFYPRLTTGKAKLDALLEKRVNFGKEVKKENGKCDPDKFLPPGLRCYGCTEATRHQCYSPLCRAHVNHAVESSKRGDTKQKFDLGFRSGPQKKVLRKKVLPPIQTFMTNIGKRRSVLVLDKVDYKKLSRKGGLGEAQGFNYLSKSNSEVWNYGSSPRPVLRTMWRWRNTQSLHNSCSWIALQLRILWHCLKWDDIAMKPPPGGSNTVTTDSQVETSELVKRRDLPPYLLRSEYLVRKITVPIDLPTKPREKTTPQRSGLRERRRPESPQNKGPQISEVWTAEEHLEIWELKIFQEKLEKQIKDRQQEKVRINTPATQIGDRVQLVHITPRTTVVSAGVTTPINSNNIIGVKVVGPGKSPAEIRATMEANLRAQRLAHQNNKKIMSVTTTTTNSLGTVVVSGAGMISGQGGTVVQTNIGGLGVRRIVAQAGQGQLAQLQTVRNTGPKQIIIRPAGANATVIASGSGTRMVSPTIGAVIRQGGVRPQVQILQGPNGQLTVRGLQPGQQLLKLPDGRLQLVNMNQQKPISLPTQSGQPVQKIMIQTAPTGQPGGAGQRFIQIRPALPVGTPTHLPTTTVRAVKIIQAAQPTGSPVVTAVSQAGSIIQAGSGQTVQVVQASSGQAMLLNAGTVLTTNAGQGSTTTTFVHPGGGQLPQKVVLSPMGQTPQLIVTNAASSSSNVVPMKTEIKKELLPNPSTPTSMAPRIIVASQPLGPKLVSNTIAPVQVVRATPVASIKSGASPQAIGAAASTAPATGGSTTFVLGPAITQQIVKQASMNTTNVETREFGFQTSEASRTPTPIQNQTKTLPPLLPLNKKQTPQIVSKAVNAVAVKPEPPNDENSTNPNTRQDEVKDPIDATVPAVTPPAVVQAPATCDSSQVSQQVLGSAAAPTEKEEKRTHPAPARKPKLRDPEFQRRLQRSKALVNRHADILRKSIMRKRALMEKKLALQIENEVQKERLKVCQVQPQQQPQPQPSKFASNSPSLATSNGSQLKTVPAVAKKVPPQGPVKTAQLKPPGQPANKKRAASNASPATNAPCPSSSPAKKRAHAVATPSTEDSTVYCICKRRYDPTKFMIGCDLCENWFHIACIGVSEAEAQRMDGWVCLDCTQKKSDAAVELFCICRTPYDESQFYIYCDNCQGWFHGRCVGVLQSEANNIDVYICPDCKIKTGADEESLKLLNKPLTKIDLDSLKKLLLAVRNHKQAWPFKEPVNRKQAPDYYKVIKNPMDLRTVEQNLTASKYTTLQQFVNDMTLIFDNCRYYNSKQSNFYSCADLLEAFFVQKMKLYKEALQRRM